MRCPKCSNTRDQVIDSRMTNEGAVIRRRRECLRCNHRFTTYEEVFQQELHVVKKDGRHETFQKQKIRQGLEKACEKRPVSMEQIDRMVDGITDEIERRYEREVPAKAIGEIVMNQLRNEDEVAYVRYASVYRQFRDIGEFVKEIQTLSEG